MTPSLVECCVQKLPAARDRVVTVCFAMPQWPPFGDRSGDDGRAYERRQHAAGAERGEEPAEALRVRADDILGDDGDEREVVTEEAAHNFERECDAQRRVLPDEPQAFLHAVPQCPGRGALMRLAARQ